MTVEMQKDSDSVEGTPVYPIDAYGAGDESVDQPGNSTPQPRSKNVRRQMMAQQQNRTTPKQQARAKRALAKQQSKIMTQERTRKALELRKAGATYDAIAKQLEYHDAGGARKAVQRAIEKVVQEPAIELKTIQIERLNHMLMVLWGKVQQGDERAITTSLNIMARLDDLVGTLASQQVDVNVQHSGAVVVIDGNEEDFITGMKRMAGIVAQDGRNHGAAALPASAPQVMFPPGMGPSTSSTLGDDPDIMDADIVEDTLDQFEEPMIPATPTTKKFSFGVDPTVKRDA